MIAHYCTYCQTFQFFQVLAAACLETSSNDQFLLTKLFMTHIINYLKLV